MLEFLIFAAFFLSLVTLGALCGMIVWLSKMDTRLYDIDDRVLKLELVKANAFIRNANADYRKHYLWSPTNQEEADDHD